MLKLRNEIKLHAWQICECWWLNEVNWNNHVRTSGESWKSEIEINMHEIGGFEK